MSATAHAHPNIALVKYWGKHDGTDNVPATPSLSITLDTLLTRTRVAAAGSRDRIYFDDQLVADAKVLGFLAALRACFDIPHLEVRTYNNFPTAAGLASSASGFAALITAVNVECELKLNPEELSDWARRASASAARSVFGGFVALRGPDWRAQPLLAPDRWPLRVVVAVTTGEPKQTPSSQGMALSKATSPYFSAWVSSTQADFERGLDIVDTRDFSALAELAELSCLKMHALMLSTNPGLIYWNAATVAAIHAVRALRESGIPVFFTVDAGPQLKAVCLPEAEDAVRQALQSVPGVQRIMSAGLGPGARTVEP